MKLKNVGRKMLTVETFVCSECGEEFEASCLVEFEEKKKKHKCRKTNKRVARTVKLQNQMDEQFIDDTAVNNIEQHNFDKLVRRGIIV